MARRAAEPVKLLCRTIGGGLEIQFPTPDPMTHPSVQFPQGKPQRRVRHDIEHLRRHPNAQLASSRHREQVMGTSIPGDAGARPSWSPNSHSKTQHGGPWEAPSTRRSSPSWSLPVSSRTWRRAESPSPAARCGKEPVRSCSRHGPGHHRLASELFASDLGTNDETCVMNVNVDVVLLRVEVHLELWDARIRELSLHPLLARSCPASSSSPRF